MTLNWNFLRGLGVQAKKPSVGGLWIFSETTQYTTLIKHMWNNTNVESKYKM